MHTWLLDTLVVWLDGRAARWWCVHLLRNAWSKWARGLCLLVHANQSVWLSCDWLLATGRAGAAHLKGILRRFAQRLQLARCQEASVVPGLAWPELIMKLS